VIVLRHLLSCARSVAQSIVFHNADDIWAVELPTEFETEPAHVHTVFYFWTIYRAKNLPLKDEQSVPLPFCQHLPRFTDVYSWTGRIKVLSDVPGEMTADVFADRRSTYLQFGFFAARRFSIARRTIASSTTLKNNVDNTFPCLSPCRISKGS
jgi:hypothetical protein